MLARVIEQNPEQEYVQPPSPIASLNGYYLDQYARVTKNKPSSFVPAIDVVTPSLVEGEQIIDPSIVRVVSLIDALSKTELALEHAKIYNDNYIEITLTDQTRVVCSTKCDPFSVVSSLQSIITAYEVEGRILETVDFRFSKPFVVERYGT